MLRQRFIEEAGGWFEAEGGGEVIVRRDVLALGDGVEAEEPARELLDDGYRGLPATLRPWPTSSPDSET